MGEEENYEAPASTPNPQIMWASMSNGVLGAGVGSSGLLVHAATRAYHLPNEAGTKYFRHWMDMSDDEIRAFRLEAMNFFLDHMEVTSVKPEIFDSEPIDNTIDLGGGNAIYPYAVTESAEHHLIGTKSSSGAEFSNARVHEVGFVLAVGRAGIWTYAGHVPYGSLIQYGYYIAEFETGSVPVKFYDHYPQVPNPNSHFAVVQRCIHPEFGFGLCQGLLKFTPENGFIRSESRLNWKWDNL